MTKVINIRQTRNWKDKANFIGRGSIFGNPFKIGKDGDRDEVIEKYREYFYAKLAKEKQFREAVLMLRFQDVACYCAPKKCHGDIIVEFLSTLIVDEDYDDKWVIWKSEPRLSLKGTYSKRSVILTARWLNKCARANSERVRYFPGKRPTSLHRFSEFDRTERSLKYL